ncbi:type IV pilus modification PilV family protein [Sediminibacillus albus]|uniref:Prepilin-type N-terminal cleavage/methylation domain-containing protein n=1 Tax=Sediminibacillus albus TaxID=407036 RepID=A0A1G9BQC5_9BACI|nr:type II secretion system protein [Sediminibacillus albus]SDK41105.1 prepilin-type N-terminal cleavage/methylation domain-containing protein [Sediminibacillus albus]
MRNKQRYLQNSSGLTLIEILVSITILSIVIVSFLTLFVQAAQTNHVSEKIIDGTYIAETHLEEVYHISHNTKGYEKSIDALRAKYTSASNSNIVSNDTEGYHVTVELKTPDQESQLGSVIVKVYQKGSPNKLEAQMESIIDWESQRDGL